MRAQSNLGVMYHPGKGVPQDDAEAVWWYRLAAGQGDADAQNNLGVNYANGEGVPKHLLIVSAARCRPKEMETCTSL
jgi:TPR repeat protein